MMLNVGDTALIVIDVQGKLAQLMHERDELFDNVARMVRGANVLELPVICTEQNPAGLGPTTEEIAPLIKSEPIPKKSFSCCGEQRFLDALGQTGRRQLLLCGIETHVCVYQTAADLSQRGHEVYVVADAVSSRAASNREIGLEMMKDAGTRITSVEAALFGFLRVAEGDKFKQILQIVK
jgi:nicotinamidase-related amidase